MNQQLKVWAIVSWPLTVESWQLIDDSFGESIEERMADALAHGGDEGRDKLR